MVSDSTLQALLQFRRERDWEQFHTPRNLAVAIAVEAGELLEQFQWATSDSAPPGSEATTALRHELADVAILLTYLAHDLGIDLDSAVQEKLARNAARYPIEESRGSAVKRTFAWPTGGSPGKGH